MKSFDAPNKSRKIRARAAPHPLAFAYTIADAQSMGAPGRTTIYKMAKATRSNCCVSPVGLWWTVTA